jgi:predicted site-specific integrase-resolvase
MAKKEPKMLTVREVADRFDVASSTVRMWLKEGLLNGAELKESPAGQYWVIPETILREFNKPKAGRPRKPLSELKGKPRRKD